MPPPDPTREVLREIAGGQRDVVEALADMNTRIAVGDAKADLRAARLDDVVRDVADIKTALAPVAEFFKAKREADANEDANRGKWANFITPERAVRVVAALGGVGALGSWLSFRGCDVPPVKDSPFPVADAAEPATVPEGSP